MLSLLVMTGLLAVSSFAVGMLPLAILFSSKHLIMLSSLGTGLLLGTSLGVIIPEGIEALSRTHSEPPVTKIALCLMLGFTFMLILEQLVAPHAHSQHSYDHIPLQNNRRPSEVEFDAELGDLEDEQGAPRTPDQNISLDHDETRISKARAYPLSFALVMHSVADGLALGVSFFPSADGTANTSLSTIVFLAIFIHKAPTALALTSSLIQTALPRAQCKLHLAVFSITTPLSAIGAYLVLSFFSINDEQKLIGNLMLLSGGTFLYVATVLQPVGHSEAPDGPSNAVRVSIIVAGIFLPFVLGTLVGHAH